MYTAVRTVILSANAYPLVLFLYIQESQTRAAKANEKMIINRVPIEWLRNLVILTDITKKASISLSRNLILNLGHF